MQKDREQVIVIIPPPFEDGRGSLVPRGDLPHQVVQLATCLEQNRNWAIDIIDAFLEDLSFKKIISYIRSNGIKNVIIAVNTVNREINYKTVFLLNKTIKEELANCRVILVNWFFIKDIISIVNKEDYKIDCLLFGDIEQTIMDVLQGVPLDKVPGCLYRGNKKYYLSEPKVNVLVDLDLLPVPNWHYVDKYKYKIMPHRGREEKIYIISISRGCPWNKCVFCQESGTNTYYRTMSPARVVTEIKTAYELYGFKEIQFDNVQFPTNLKWLKEFKYLLEKNNIKISWSCLSRVDLLNEEKLSLMKESGCWNILVGIETFNKKAQLFLQKGMVENRLIEMINYSRKIGIEITGSFIMGIPGERPRDVFKNAFKAAMIGIDYFQNFIVKWYANNEIKIPPELGYFDKEWTYRKYDFYGPQFIPAGYRNKKRLALVYTISYLLFYLNPLVILRFFFKIRRAADFKRLFKGIDIIRNIIVK